MFSKAYYITQDSLKNIFRTKGMMSTFLLTVLVSIIAFFTMAIFLFFNHIQKGMVLSLEKETDMIEIQMAQAPIIAITLFKYLALILAVTLFLLLIGMVKRNFKQFFITQKNELKIMALLGESTKSLAIYQSIQVVSFAFFSLLLGMIIGHFIFFSSIIKTINLAMTLEEVNSFQLNYVFLIIIIFLMLLYLFITVFSESNKKIDSFLNN